MYVLSLCDGIGGGRIALHRAGIKVDKYFASEIDKNAIKCADDNWNDIIHIGDIKNVHYEDGVLYTATGEYELPYVNILMAGTPCQSFSLANMYNNATGLEGKSGLFLEALRILEEVKPKWFLFENVRMKKADKLTLDAYLGVEGKLVNSSLVSFQNRPRYYWTNIPFEMPIDRHISFQDYKEIDNVQQYELPMCKTYLRMWNNGNGKNNISFGCSNVTYADKINTVSTKQKRCPNAGLVACGDFCRTLTQNELEYAQTLPHGYTRNFSYGQAQKLIGNGWTVDVIAHILSFIKY